MQIKQVLMSNKSFNNEFLNNKKLLNVPIVTQIVKDRARAQNVFSGSWLYCMGPHFLYLEDDQYAET